MAGAEPVPGHAAACACMLALGFRLRLPGRVAGAHSHTGSPVPPSGAGMDTCSDTCPEACACKLRKARQGAFDGGFKHCVVCARRFLRRWWPSGSCTWPRRSPPSTSRLGLRTWLGFRAGADGIGRLSRRRSSCAPGAEPYSPGGATHATPAAVLRVRAAAPPARRLLPQRRPRALPRQHRPHRRHRPHRPQPRRGLRPPARPGHRHQRLRRGRRRRRPAAAVALPLPGAWRNAWLHGEGRAGWPRVLAAAPHSGRPGRRGLGGRARRGWRRRRRPSRNDAGEPALMFARGAANPVGPVPVVVLAAGGSRR